MKNHGQPYLLMVSNHENFDALAQYKVEKWHGGKVQFITPSIIHLMRGQIYDIEGLSIFTMGGATSIDKYCRVEGVDWWPQEMPSNEEYDEAFRNLDAHDNKVDLIISHAAPDQVHDMLTFAEGSHDKLTNFLEIVRQTVEFKQWYFGHYHRDKMLSSKYYVIYNGQFHYS